MANVKISALPAASTPLTGTELVPIVQSGVTSQTTVSDFGAAVSYTPSGTGAVATTVQAKLRQTVSVKDFGAVGDGATDDTVAIQAAIDAGSTSGMSVYFPDGTYVVNPLRVSVSWPSSSTCAFIMRSGMHLWSNGGATLYVKNGSSSDASPRYYTMFYSDATLSNISFSGLMFDGNWTNNLMSPSRASNTYNRYNQAFIGFFGNSAAGNNINITDCIFKNNPGENNIVCGVSNGVAVSTLGSNWTITNTTHIDGGMDAGDFTAVFAYCENVVCSSNIFQQTTSPTVYNGTGARNAYEVHGANQVFTGNVVKNYFGGVIVNSNWVQDVYNIDVSDNSFYNMYLYGIRLWRQPSTPLDQSAVSNVNICNNAIYLNTTLYNTAATVKAGIYGLANFTLAMTDININGNIVYVPTGATNLTAGVYLSTQTATSQQHTRITIDGNQSINTYYGVFCFAITGGTTFGALTISNNKVRNLRNVGANVNPIGIIVRGDSSVSNVYLSNNIVEENNGAGETKYAYWLQGTITNLTMYNNQAFGVTTIYTESSTTITVRNGDDMRQVLPTASGVSVTGWSIPTRKTYKVQVAASAFSAAALFADVTIFTIPARTRLVGIVADTTQTYTGTGITAATMRVGPSANSNLYMVDADVFTAVVTKGLSDADLGTSLNRANAVQGGVVQSWTGNANISVRLTTVGANTNQLTTGATTFYISVESVT